MPTKKTIRKALITILVACEGPTDEGFLKYLKSIFQARGPGYKIKIKFVKGKGALNVVKKTLNIEGDFNLRIAVIDIDPDKKEEIEKARNFAKKNDIPLIEIENNLEDLLNAIYKNKKYKEKNNSTNQQIFKRYFTKNLLKEKREIIKPLHQLVYLIEKGQYTHYGYRKKQKAK